MASPQEKLAGSLKALEALQRKGVVAVRSADVSRTDRERLVKAEKIGSESYFYAGGRGAAHVEIAL